MADKQITELPANSGVTNETLFPAYQPGAVEPAQKVSGAQFRAFAEQAGAAAGEQAAGDLARGGTFTPHFNPATGLLSWTNDLGLPNPDPVQLEGVSSVNGKTGAVKLSAADVGAYGLSLGKIIPNNADLDTYMELGSYYSPNATVTATLKNAPALGAGFKLSVEQGYGASHRIQKAIFNTTGRVLWRYYANSAWTGWLEAATTDYALARDGSNVMTGKLSFGKSYLSQSENSLYIAAHNDGDAQTRRMIRLANPTDMANLSDALYLYDVVAGATKAYQILHAGNKPSGSYTGNGDATQRTINTGGIGSVVAIWGGTQVTFLTANGGINYSQSSNTITGVPIAEGRFANGVIQIASTANSVNANGLTYNYQVL